jgi:hypothetical protein
MNSVRIQRTLLPILVSALLGSWGVQAQSDTARLAQARDLSAGLFPQKPLPRLYKFNVSGYYRFFATYTQHELPYYLTEEGANIVPENNLFIGDDAQLPNLMINVSGRPSERFSWAFDLYAFQFLNGIIGPAYSGQVETEDRPSLFDPISGTRLAPNMGLLLGLNLMGSYQSDYGLFNFRMGGIHWYSISDLTLAAFRGYNRFTLFEQNPWDPINGSVGQRYEDLYAMGEIEQDQRFGERAFQGLILEAMDLPDRWNLAILYGKTELNGGFLTIPNNSYGGKIKKEFNVQDNVAFNMLNGITYLDSLNTQEIAYYTMTVEVNLVREKFNIHIEAGVGKYNTPFEEFPWGEAINAKILTKPSFTGVPIELQFYRVSPNVVNSNALYWNVARQEVIPEQAGDGLVGSNALLRPFASSVLPLGLMTNNRQGLNLNSTIKLGDLIMSLGLGSAQEIEAVSNQLTFGHPVNALTRSRIWRWNFPQNVGPYGRQSVIFRDVFETMNLTDNANGVPLHRKHFSTLEAHLKYKTPSVSHPLYLFFLGRYQSVQRHYSPVPVWNSYAYFRQYSNELEASWRLNRGFYLTGYLGYERTLGNYDTDVDVETFRPRDQEGWGVGIGFDQSLGRNAGLFVRHRWFEFQDRSFALDHFRGQETLVELKVFF